MTKAILITGSSRGLGLAMARQFLQDGHVVWGCSRGNCPLEQEYPERYHHRRIDLAEEAAGRKALEGLVNGVDKFNLVILNAGILPPIRDMKDTPTAVLREAMEINVWANKWILDTVLAMPLKPDQVVGISSGAAVSGHRGWNGYAVSKAALNMLLAEYAAEEPEAHFTSLAPGLIDTAMQEYISGIEEDADFETVRRLKAARNTPAMASPEEAALSIIKLLGRLKSHESGTFIDIRNMG
ncbi:MAG: SDR family NAD(P)-dependent oxidoreductase [Oceanipulchritudo sp.]